MKKLYLHIALFVLPIVGGILAFKVPKRYLFQELKDDCLNHGIWIHDRLYENPKNIDVLILGSSHTVNGINDSLMEEQMQHKLTVANLGYCRLGRNLSYSLLKATLETKQPKHLVLEVREDEDRYSHPIYPHISSSRDVVFPNLIFNRDYFVDLSNHFLYRLQLQQDLIYGNIVPTEVNNASFGYVYLDGNASPESLETRKNRPVKPSVALPTHERDFHMQFPRRYLAKIKQLCSENNIQLHFLYMPSYASRVHTPKELATYETLGNVLLPPDSIFANTAHWYDLHHFNKPGARQLSNWLVDQLDNRLDKKIKHIDNQHLSKSIQN